MTTKSEKQFERVQKILLALPGWHLNDAGIACAGILSEHELRAAYDKIQTENDDIAEECEKYEKANKKLYDENAELKCVNSELTKKLQIFKTYSQGDNHDKF